MKKKYNTSNLNKLLLPKGHTYLSELFYENIKIKKHDLKLKEETEDFVKNLLIHQENKLTSFLSKQINDTTKDFGTMPKYMLPKSIKKQSSSLVKIINKRRSIREFSGENITLPELSTLLQASRASKKKDKIFGTKLRNIPSAGALYPLEIHFTLLRSIDSTLTDGIYHYEPNGHYITRLKKEANVEQIENFLSQPEITVRESALIFFITGILDKVGWKYADRGFYYMLIEAGHLAQNLCLLATSMKLAICPIGGFIDDEVNEYLDIGNKEITLYILIIGK